RRSGRPRSWRVSIRVPKALPGSSNARPLPITSLREGSPVVIRSSSVAPTVRPAAQAPRRAPLGRRGFTTCQRGGGSGAPERPRSRLQFFAQELQGTLPGELIGLLVVNLGTVLVGEGMSRPGVDVEIVGNLGSVESLRQRADRFGGCVVVMVSEVPQHTALDPVEVGVRARCAVEGDGGTDLVVGGGKRDRQSPTHA